MFFVCVWNISGTAKQICATFTGKTHFVHRSDEFECQRERLKVKVTRDKNRHFSALSAACVRLVFGKTSLASSLYFYLYDSQDRASIAASRGKNHFFYSA